MPIDSAGKRRSAGGVGFVPLGPGVSPDAARAPAWRQQAGWGYSGIAAAAPPTPGVAAVVPHEGLRRNVGRLMR